MSTLKTYLVEDSPVIRANLTATLQDLAPVRMVGWAADEGAAVRWLAEPGNEAQLVIVDLFLRAGSGLGVLRAAARFGRPVHLVALSNYAGAEVRRRCLELGADRVFDKSSGLDELIDYCNLLASAGSAAGASPAKA